MSATDKAKNRGQIAEGDLKETVGKATGDRSLEAEGRADQASGNLKQAAEKARDAAKDALR